MSYHRWTCPTIRGETKADRQRRRALWNYAIIMDGNSKLHKIPNISLPPIISCPKGIPCAQGCYAIKAYRQYPDVRAAWWRNWRHLKQDRARWFSSILLQLQTKRPAFFRIHVAGDFVDRRAFAAWKRIARLCPETQFLAFTKQHGFNYADLPANMTIIASMWPNLCA